jgi:uncharacterized protein (DUF2235 family)
LKRIVLCADGTWNERDQRDDNSGKRRPTNVTKLARAISACDKNSVPQLVIYHDGVGTSGGVDKLTGGAFGDGIEKNIQELYRSILYNYQTGDELFLFGFSRGAFTVRTLAGFINRVGLLGKGDDYWLPEIYDCYKRGLKQGTPEWAQAFHGVKGTPSAATIHFIGVWDTVGALGAPGILGHIFNGKKYQYHDVGLNKNILNAYQALAIDEHRIPFAPSVWTRPAGWTGNLVQAWFPGVHSDVGGSNTPDGLANEALHWIIGKAEQHGLAVDALFLSHYTPCFNGTLHDSMTLAYRALGTLDRPIGTDPTETVHQATLDRLGHAPSAYSPRSLAAFLGVGKSVVPENTTRISRGVPCPEGKS